PRKKLQINKLTPTDIIIRLTDKTQKQTIKIIKNILIKIKNYFFPTDFIILNIKKHHPHPIILKKLFLTTAKTLIDIKQKKLNKIKKKFPFYILYTSTTTIHSP
ncbi:hypothetical protein DF186_14610, partial [Enterococcus hirae]